MTPDAGREITPRLPSYAHPPVVAVSLALQLAQPLSPDVIGDFSAALGPEWQRSADSSTAVLETPLTGAVCRHLLGDQQLRVDGRQFRFTWDGRQGETYPHYERVRDGLFQNWDLLCALCGRREESIPPVSGWMVRYSNRIPRGTVWTSLTDCSFCRLFPKFDEQPGQLAPCSLEAKWQFEASRAQSEFLIETHTSRADGPLGLPCLWIDLECRGSGEGTAEEAASGLDYGRELIVTTFRSLMTPAANAYWGLD